MKKSIQEGSQMLKIISSLKERISNRSHEMTKKNRLKKHGFRSGVYVIKSYDSDFYVVRSGDGFLII